MFGALLLMQAEKAGKTRHGIQSIAPDLFE
jgi:hypothetical protein